MQVVSLRDIFKAFGFAQQCGIYNFMHNQNKKILAKDQELFKTQYIP
jgi:hypothetical protein